MRLACLAADDEVSQLAAAAVAAGHRLTAAYESDRSLLPRLPGAAEGWEALLHGTVADAVIVGGWQDADRRADQLRKLAQAGIPMLLAHPACEPIVAFELEMIRADTDCTMVSYFPGIHHPAIDRLTQLAQSGDSPIGRVEQVVVERALGNRDRATVMRWLARDIELVRRLLGPLRKVSAIGPRHESDAFHNLVVTMANAGEQLARWSVAPAAGAEVATLSVVGEKGRATLTMTADPSGWRLELPGEPPVTFPGWDDARHVIDDLEEVLEGRAASPAWSDICRAMEVWDAIPFSLRRGRQIELHGEEHTETGTFKGIMSVGSCGLLLFLFFLLVFGAVLEGFRLPMRPADRPRIAEFDELPVAEREEEPRRHILIRLWPVYPLLLFLVLQLLLFIAKRPPRRSG